MTRSIEQLESRRLLSAYLTYRGTLAVFGTSGDDTANIAIDGTDATKLDVTLNGTQSQFTLANVKRIFVFLGAGNDSATVDSGVTINSFLAGGRGEDSLTGGGGNDRLDGNGGVNQLTGGPGNDTFIVTATDSITDFLDGTDTKFVKFLTFGALEVNGTSLADNLNIAVDGTDTTQLDVTLNGNTTQFPLASFTRIDVHLGDGDDTAVVDANVTLPVFLHGDGGNDTMTGGSGDDKLDGGAGINQLTGGAGADTFIVAGNDVVTDFTDGTDTRIIKWERFGELEVNGTDAADVVTVALNADPTKVDINVNGTISTFNLSEFQRLELKLGAGDDTATVDAAITFPVEIEGGDGNDTLVGGGGNDKLKGGEGTDSLTGGAGADRFYTDSDDNDVIADLNTSEGDVQINGYGYGGYGWHFATPSFVPHVDGGIFHAIATNFATFRSGVFALMNH